MTPAPRGPKTTKWLFERFLHNLRRYTDDRCGTVVNTNPPSRPDAVPGRQRYRGASTTGDSRAPVLTVYDNADSPLLCRYRRDRHVALSAA